MSASPSTSSSGAPARKRPRRRFVRAIPALLLRREALVKTVKFQSPRYVGDPINTVQIFSQREVDELLLLDITATPERRGPNLDLIERVSAECFMPLAYGGGIRSLEDATQVLRIGVEKVVLNTAAWRRPSLIGEIAARYGSQALIVAIDVRRRMFGAYEVVIGCGAERTGKDPVQWARQAVAAGAGELLITSIDRDGTFDGYDLELTRRVASAVSVPVVAGGGAGSLGDMARAVREAGAHAAAAGSLFVFQGRNRSVLVNYPDRSALDALFL